MRDYIYNGINSIQCNWQVETTIVNSLGFEETKKERFVFLFMALAWFYLNSASEVRIRKIERSLSGEHLVNVFK